ncbi:hypothetical protein OQA88_5534 [Cercophora sp. LCS_1]
MDSMSATSKTPLYFPLDSSRSETRLLGFVSPIDTDQDRMLKLNLTTVSLNQRPSFVALSYVWGDGLDTVPVSVNGTIVWVTLNLERALRDCHGQLKEFGSPSPMGNGVLRADAICINQDDVNEREGQLLLMRRIYKSARMVLAWLENDYRDVFSAFRILYLKAQETWTTARIGGDGIRLLKPEPPDLGWMNSCAVFSSPDIWSRINNFLDDPYWTRVWILQEVVLGDERLSLLSVDSTCTWEMVSSVAMCFSIYTESAWGQPAEQFRIPEPARGYLKLHGLVYWEPIVFCATLQGREFMVASDRTLAEGALLTDRLARACVAATQSTHTPNFSTGSPWTWALEAALDGCISPDYASATAADVCIQFVSGFLSALKGTTRTEFGLDHPLRFLYSAGVGHIGYDESMPTWVPNFPQEYGKMHVVERRRMLRHADRGIFPDDSHYAHITGKSLRVDGIVVQRIQCIEAPFKDTLENWRTRGRKGLLRSLLVPIRAYRLRFPTYATGTPVLQAFFHLLTHGIFAETTKTSIEMAFWLFLALLDCDPDGSTTPLYFLGYPANWSIIKRGYPLRLCASFKDLEAFFVEQFFPGTQLREFGLEHMVADAWNKGFEEYIKEADTPTGHFTSWFLDFDSFRMVRTASGFLGWGPGGTEEGDLVCVLKDCGFPVILRRVESHYIFVGAAFVLGLMGGEARRFAEDGTAVVEAFEIR